jgi:hypothetical protein
MAFASLGFVLLLDLVLKNEIFTAGNEKLMKGYVFCKTFFPFGDNVDYYF